jgi:ParB family chromosome partitioning protein
VLIGLDTMDGAEHPLYDLRIKEPLNEELVSSIEVHGVFDPVHVRKNGDSAECVDGRQRIRAAREVNKRRRKAGGKELVFVPAMLQRADDEQFALKVEIGNSCRLVDGPITRARKAQRLIDMGHGEASVARGMGITEKYLGQLLSLLETHAAVKTAVEDGKLAVSAAVKLAKLSRDQQVEQLAELQAAGGKVTEKRARAAVAKSNGKADTYLEPPSKRDLKNLDEVCGSFVAEGKMPREFWMGIMYARGVPFSHENVRGLVDAIKAANQFKRKPRENR